MKAKVITGDTEKMNNEVNNFFKKDNVRIKDILYTTIQEQKVITILYNYVKQTKFLLLLLIFFGGCTLETREEQETKQQISTIKKWQDGIVYYQFADDFSNNEKKIIHECMEYWEVDSIVEFVESSDNEYVVNIYKRDYFSSTIGQLTFSYMNLKNSNKKHITHELGHVLGLTHEHQRPDRDNYIKVNYKNIEENQTHNFDKIINPLHENIEYDYKSIMHYGAYAFSHNNKPTIEKFKLTINFSDKPSILDLQKINLIYKK